MSTAGQMAGMQKHNDRTNNVRNADSDLTHLNRTYSRTKSKDIRHDVEMRLTEADVKVRKNSVKAVEYLLTASPEAFKFEKVKDEKGRWTINGPVKKWNEFQKKSIQWLIDRHGKENVVHYSVHFDEKTPHIHAYCTPIIKKEVKWKNQKGSGVKIQNSLTARDFNGTKQMLRDMQDSFALSMSSLGLERGERGSNAKHEHIQKYYTRVNEAQKFNEEIRDFEVKPMSVDIKKPSRIGNLEEYREKTEEKVNKVIQEAQISGASQISEQFRGEFERMLESKKLNADLRGEISSLRKDIENKEYEVVKMDLARKEALNRGDAAFTALKEFKNLTRRAFQGDLIAQRDVLNQLNLKTKQKGMGS